MPSAVPLPEGTDVFGEIDRASIRQNADGSVAALVRFTIAGKSPEQAGTVLIGFDVRCQRRAIAVCRLSVTMLGSPFADWRPGQKAMFEPIGEQDAAFYEKVIPVVCRNQA